MPVVRSAELLSVGTELLLGEIVDTNSAWIAARLAARGVDVYWSRRVGDNLGRVREAIEEALARSDLLVVGGGLGPTDDDLTREAIAAAIGEEPRVDPELERALRERFARFSRRMPESNLKQAWLVPSAVALPNPLGTAPGWLVRVERGGRERTIAALPGPPREMTRMWTEELEPRLELPAAALRVRTFKIEGIGESALAERLGAWTRSPNPTVATYAKSDGVHVRVATKADDPEEARRRAAPAEAAVLEAVSGLEHGGRVWGEGDDELPDAALRALAERGWGLAVWDAATGGAVAAALSLSRAAPHAAPRAAPAGVDAGPLRGCVVAWSIDATAVLDGVHARTAEPSARIPDPIPDGIPQDDPAARRAAARALAVRERFGAEVGLALEPAEPEPGSSGSDDDAVRIVALAPSGARVRAARLPALGPAWRAERLVVLALSELLALARRAAPDPDSDPEPGRAPAARHDGDPIR